MNSPQPRCSAIRAKPTAPVGATMRPRMLSSTATPTLLGQRRVRGTDRSLRDATHSHNDIRAKMPRKMANRIIASLDRSSLVIAEPFSGSNAFARRSLPQRQSQPTHRFAKSPRGAAHSTSVPVGTVPIGSNRPTASSQNGFMFTLPSSRPPEQELCSDLDGLSVHFHYRIGEEIDWPGCRFRLHH